ncbi:zinc ribbon domain-containing protein [Rhodovulum tesquicola]|uniref:FmdB family zinc ribbon protein n=1 Tax=Rhodovulum tesquicola TaxID=540254 RepID=UPI0020979022|nr:zinc ribbon domain-containing protein [Rhodovulum tesquicola]MCO8146047.1 zinc ribbon domain-containing protein [Rhodovulum tesquicola]
MPMLAYRCDACGADCELLMRPSDPPPVCPGCGSGDLRQTLSRVAQAGKTGALIAGARRLAAREGHFSNYAKTERPGRS